MFHRSLLTVLAACAICPGARALDPSDLKPGLVARFDASEKSPASAGIVRLEPTVALALKEGETPHPRLGQYGHAEWRGYINIVRPGKYTFTATLQGGTLTVQVGGKNVYRATAGAEPLTRSDAEVALEGGVQPFAATFMHTPGAGRVELFWQGPGFVKEPLPHQFLGHIPRDRPAEFAKNVELEHGRFKFEELACIRCHKPAASDAMAKGLSDRSGPNLTDIGKRAYPGWIDAWLADPAKLRPQTTMPALFTADDRGQAERYAVTKYLLSLAGTAPMVAPRASTVVSNDLRQSLERGRVLFSVTGCAVCHQQSPAKARNDEEEREPLKPDEFFSSLGTAGPSSKYVLGALGSKTRVEPLSTYLQDPLKTNPHGRMPRMNLNAGEAADLARYLCRITDDTLSTAMPRAPRRGPAELGETVFEAFDPDSAVDDLPAFRKLPAEKQWLELGRKLVVLKGCVNCHAIEPGGKALSAGNLFPSLAKVRAARANGCLGEKPNPAKVPVYSLEPRETEALAAFLKEGLAGAGTSAPTYSARMAFRRFNCLNCHSRDGEGGIPTELANQVRLLEKAENADDVRPPLLTGIGHKSRTAWLKSVLTGSGRARPWMQLRMPQYGDAEIGFLPDALAGLDGAVPDDIVHKPQLNVSQIQVGRQIVGKSGLGCISCHDIGGVPNTGTRGPDLATIDQRVRYDWYERWLHQPLRMAPGTRMPQAFVEGRSALATVLSGEPKAQAEAMWAYLSLGPGLPLPEGLEPPKGLIIAAKDRPELLRTFMPDAGSKGIAVGYPGGFNIAFSADQCRLAYAWAGNFLDASPVWANRGGAPAKLLGPKFWTAPAGHPWGLTANPRIPPDFAGRANNPAFGLPLPLEPARIYDGPRAVNFEGYALDTDDRPTFHYTLRENARDGVLTVAETPVPIAAAIATGFIRRFTVEAPASYRAWFFAGQTGREPRAVALGGMRTLELNLNADEPVVTASGTRIVLPQEGDRAIVLEARGAPEGTVWCFVSRSGSWQALLRLPETNAKWKGAFDVAVWALPRDSDAFVRDLGVK